MQVQAYVGTTGGYTDSSDSQFFDEAWSTRNARQNFVCDNYSTGHCMLQIISWLRGQDSAFGVETYEQWQLPEAACLQYIHG